MERLIVLDTETTGIEYSKGHRIIEIGAVEIIDRQITDNCYHQYLKPDRNVGESIRIHGISDNFLKDKPKFADVNEAFLQFISNSALIIHNAPFDLGFLNNELALADSWQTIDNERTIIDTLELSKKQRPGSQHGLDALCRRYKVDNTERELHGALLDAQLLAKVYLAMTGGQKHLFNQTNELHQSTPSQAIKRLNIEGNKLAVIYANQAELNAHNNYFDTADTPNAPQ